MLTCLVGLMDICRLAIRNQVHSTDDVVELDLPTSLKDFLIYK